MDINDWTAIQTLFDKLHKDADKAAKGARLAPGAHPRAYVRLLSDLEAFIAESLAAKKKMSSSNAKALNTMRQRVRKHNSGGTVAAALAAWRANPVSSASESEGPAPGGADSDADSDGGAARAAADAAAAGDDDGFQKVGPRGGAAKKDKILTTDPSQITYEAVDKKLRELVLARGKKGVDRQEQLDMLTYLATVAKGPTQRARARSSRLSPPSSTSTPPCPPTWPPPCGVAAWPCCSTC